MTHAASQSAANPFLSVADAQQNAWSKARDRRMAKLVIKSEAEAPMVASPSDRAVQERSALLRQYNKALTQRRHDLLNGKHGTQIKELLGLMDTLTPSSAPGLMSYLAKCNWFLHAERSTRQDILSLIDIGICRHRVREGLAPFDDSLPGEQPTAFEIIRSNMQVLS
jgi:hypothetical protein